MPSSALAQTRRDARAPSPPQSRRRLLGIGLGVAIAATTFVFVLPRIADYGDVWAVLEGLTWEQAGALVAATALNLVSLVPPWMVALPGLGFRRALLVTRASTASTYIAPGGGAVGVAVAFTVLRSWGFPSRPVGLAVSLTGIGNQLASLAFPVVALALLTMKEESNAVLETGALIGFAIFVAIAAAFAVALSTPKLARFVGNTAARIVDWLLRLVGRGPVGWSGRSFVRFRKEALALLRRRWQLLTLSILAAQLSGFLLLLVSLRTLDVSASEVSAVEAFAAWSVVRLLGSVPITPGGVGVVEIALTTALVGFGGANAEVVAAVLVYRFLTIVPALVLGLMAFAASRRLGLAAPVRPGRAPLSA